VPEIEETDLPGVGLRFEFVTDAGNRIGVIHHRSGRRELFACEADDPDAVSVSLRLSDDESHALADALGGSTVVENLNTLEQRIEGLAIDWLGVDDGTPYVGRTLGEAGVRTRTGVSVVAVIRGDTAVPAPGPEFLVMASDVLVVVGTTDGIASVKQILSSG
jgi:K+:H+ antiporter subunit KhtT